MSVKIFLPTELFHTKADCDIYGEIQISDNNAISYFIVAYSSSEDTNNACEQLRHLGQIARAGPTSALQQRDVSISFAYDDDTPNIYLLKLSIKSSQSTQVNIFLYDVPKMLQLNGCNVKQPPVSITKAAAAGGGDADNSCETEQCDDVRMLYRLLQDCRRNALQSQQPRPRSMLCAIGSVLYAPLQLITQIFVLLLEWQPIFLLLRHTFFYEHYLEWKTLRTTGKRNVNIIVEKIFGICVMLLLLFYISHPGNNLLQASHLVIQKLRWLLRSLKGSPIGLKLNEHLNNFLLDCFKYHVDLWAQFLDLIEPLVRQLFVPIALLGCMGLSYQLALLSDLLSVMGLHAHCFYIYSAMLYKVELKGIQVLWKVMLGKRYNVLKNRVESHNYMNRQLYLATIFFTSLLFLFPTILMYYVVFTTLRLCIYPVNELLHMLRRGILEFPLYSLGKWCCRRFYDMESLQLQYVHHVPSPLLQPEATQMRMSVFKLNVQPSALGRVFSCESGILQEFTTTKNEQTGVKSIFNRILKGDF